VTDTKIGGWLRVLALLLVVWEPLGFAVAASGAMNALAVRGTSVALVLAARLVVTALSVAAGLTLLDGRRAGVALGAVALGLSACVQLIGALTPYFPSNRVPGDAPLYVMEIAVYYGGWLIYLATSRRARALTG
jgi:hypothetical protein